MHKLEYTLVCDNEDSIARNRVNNRKPVHLGLLEFTDSSANAVFW